MLPNSNVKGSEVRAIFDTTATACCDACATDSNWCALAEAQQSGRNACRLGVRYE